MEHIVEPTLTIQEMSAATNVSAHTLRYYERIGLLRDVKRNAQGYRVYSQYNITWIEFLLRLRDTGMPIAEIQQFAELRSQGDGTASARRQMLDQHQQQLQHQLIQLQDHLTHIGDKIQYYRELEKKTHLS